MEKSVREGFRHGVFHLCSLRTEHPCEGPRRIGEHPRQRQDEDLASCLLSAVFKRQGIDMLHISDCRSEDRPCGVWHRALQQAPAEMGMLKTRYHRIPRCVLDPFDRFTEPAEPREVVDPAQDGDGDQGDQTDRDD